MKKHLSQRLAMLSLAVATAATLGACAATPTSEGTGQYLDDTVITAKVKAAVLNEPTLKSAEINVETFKGRVQLSGFVSSRADIDKAVAVARDVMGVTSVANDMRIK
jgi:osmotically-inducible protein OsmY